MVYEWIYESPSAFDNIILKSDGKYLTALLFESKINNSANNINNKQPLKVFKETTKWLDIYFSGKQPDFIPPYKINDLTPFRQEVIDIISTIPYGKTVTYGDIAKYLELKKGIKKMSAQAVGNAVHFNPICIIIPCHRVIGIKGNLTGYGGGINNKVALLKLEQNDMSKYHMPKGNKI